MFDENFFVIIDAFNFHKINIQNFRDAPSSTSKMTAICYYIPTDYELTNDCVQYRGHNLAPASQHGSVICFGCTRRNYNVDIDIRLICHTSLHLILTEISNLRVNRHKWHKLNNYYRRCLCRKIRLCEEGLIWKTSFSKLVHLMVFKLVC